MNDDEFHFDFDMNDTGSSVPDTADELLEEWQKDESVLNAMKEVVEAEAEKISAEAHVSELQKSEAETQAALNDLMNKVKELQHKQRNIRNELFRAKTPVRKAEEKYVEAKKKIDIARESYERKQETRRKRDEFFKDAEQYAWYKGVTMPDGKVLKILEHQIEGAMYCAISERVVEADKMGVGKTLTAIATLDLMKSKRVLIVTPADVATNFLRELRMWAPHRAATVLTGLNKQMRHITLQMLDMLDEFTVVINYEAWRKDAALIDAFIRLQFDTVIMDEAHVMKTLRSDAYQGMRSVVHATNQCPKCRAYVVHTISEPECTNCGWVYSREVARSGGYLDPHTKLDVRTSVRRVIPMTGTPILNSPEDIFTMLNLIDPYNFDEKHKFLNVYATMDYNTGKWRFRAGGIDSLLKQLSGKFISRSMEDAGVILPEQKAIIHELEITPEEYPDQWRVMQQLSKHATIMLSDGSAITALATIALITRQRQANVYPGGIKLIHPVTKQVMVDVSEEVNESIKLDKAVEMIKEFVENGERIAVFSQFATGLGRLKEMLDAVGIRSVRFDGSTPDAIKEQVKTNFNKSLGEEPKWDVVLANYKTGGVGLNMTACTQMIIVDEEWNPGKRDQAYARLARIGQDQRTFVHVLQIKKSIDTWMHGLIEEKEDMIAGFEAKQQDFQQMYLDALKNGEV